MPGTLNFYICDRKACNQCSDECRHTTDITHAKNFSKEAIKVQGKKIVYGYFEKEDS